MTFLQQLVFCSISYRGRVFQDYSTLPYKVQMFLKSVTQKQRHKFREFGIVPLPVLSALWQMGFLPYDRAPERGMKIPVLTEYLCTDKYKTDQAADRGQWLYAQIIQEEFIGKRPVTRK